MIEDIETKKKRGKKMKKKNGKKEVEKILIDDFEGEGGPVEISLEAIKKGGGIILIAARPKK